MSSVNCNFRCFLNIYEHVREDVYRCIEESQSDLSKSLNSPETISSDTYKDSNFVEKQLTKGKRNHLEYQEVSKKHKTLCSRFTASLTQIPEADMEVIDNVRKIEVPVASFNELELQSVRIGLIFALLPGKFFDALVKTVVEYDLDSYYDVISTLQNEQEKVEVSNDLKKMMEVVTVLDLRTCSKSF